jgi:hypothetical protein
MLLANASMFTVHSNTGIDFALYLQYEANWSQRYFTLIRINPTTACSNSRNFFESRDRTVTTLISAYSTSACSNSGSPFRSQNRPAPTPTTFIGVYSTSTSHVKSRTYTTLATATTNIVPTGADHTNTRPLNETNPT